MSYHSSPLLTDDELFVTGCDFTTVNYEKFLEAIAPHKVISVRFCTLESGTSYLHLTLASHFSVLRLEGRTGIFVDEQGPLKFARFIEDTPEEPEDFPLRPRTARGLAICLDPPSSPPPVPSRIPSPLPLRAAAPSFTEQYRPILPLPVRTSQRQFHLNAQTDEMSFETSSLPLPSYNPTIASRHLSPENPDAFEAMLASLAHSHHQVGRYSTTPNRSAPRMSSSPIACPTPAQYPLHVSTEHNLALKSLRPLPTTPSAISGARLAPSPHVLPSASNLTTFSNNFEESPSVQDELTEAQKLYNIFTPSPPIPVPAYRSVDPYNNDLLDRNDQLLTDNEYLQQTLKDERSRADNLAKLLELNKSVHLAEKHMWEDDRDRLEGGIKRLERRLRGRAGHAGVTPVKDQGVLRSISNFGSVEMVRGGSSSTSLGSADTTVLGKHDRDAYEEAFGNQRKHRTSPIGLGAPFMYNDMTIY